MTPDIEQAIARLQDPSQRSWFRARCATWPERQRAFHSTVASLGLPMVPLSERLEDQRPDVWAWLQPSVYRDHQFRARYRTELQGSLLADVYEILYTCQVDNAAPTDVRLDPFCETTSRSPLLEVHALFEADLVPALARLGWRRMSIEEEFEHVDGLGMVRAALSVDVNGWLEGAEPLPPTDEAPIRSFLDAVFKSDARSVVDSAPDWIHEIELILASAGRCERLTPERYPSVSWTVDFGEQRNGTFEARFFTDIHISKLAPAWYYTDRFVLAHIHPQAIERELAGWTINEIGYLKSQTSMVASARSALARRGITELEDFYLWFQVAAPRGGRAQLGELLFRDVEGFASPAPRLESEGINRHLRPRIGHL
jgi:hypothetical protein